MTRIVIVDDRKTNLRILRQMTQAFERGAAIETFGHVEAAKDWRALYAADVIVTAFDRTKSNGAEFTRWLRAEVQDFDAPILATTAHENVG